jgi:hypothetical protein
MNMSKEILQIQLNGVKLLAKKVEDALEFGPGHIVFSDGNVEDTNIDYCIGLCDHKTVEYRNTYLVQNYTNRELEIVIALLTFVKGFPVEGRNILVDFLMDR